MSTRVTPAERAVLEIGPTFADYRIDGLAGRQRGVGRVYVATHLESERSIELPPWPVALKVFSPPSGQEVEFRARFESTAKLQASLNHPNAVSVYEVGTEPLPFMSMTLFRGPTLADLVGSRALNEPDILPIVDSVAGALDGGIERGLCYRRLRPGGVLVATDAQRAFLGDFGVGRAAGINDLLDNEELGTYVDYISPEEVRSAEVSERSLVYSLAAIVFEALTGEPPYPYQEGEQSLRARIKEPPRKLRDLRPDLPGGLEAALSRALDADPGRRPASPGELAKAIRGEYPPRRPRAPRLRATTTLAKMPPLTASGPAAEAATDPRGEVLREEEPSGVRPATTRSRRVLSPAVLLVALLVAAAAALGALVAPDPQADTTTTPPEELTSSSGNLRYPADWERVGDAPAVPGVQLRDPVALAPRAGAASSSPTRALVTGHAALDSLPRGSSALTVDLGAVQAYRHEAIEAGSGNVNLYVVPTSEDAIAVACLAPSAADPFLDRCERVASTLELRGGVTAVALAPSPAYARGLRRIVERLDAARRSARSRLRAARTRNGQGGNAARLASAYQAAATSAKRLAAPPGARAVHARIVAGLKRAESGYRGMAAAAKARSGGRWRASRGAAVSGENGVQGALNGLRDLGYRPAGG